MADDADDRTASLVGTVLGRYSVGRLLGQGGMGVVYEATHRELGRRVAIKTMRESYAASSESRQRFLREGKAAAQIQHANVADVFDVAIEEGCPYLVMEYLEGEDLACLVAREAPLSIERTSDIVMPVVAALAAAHDRGIVHRDLKPQNIFLARERTGVVPKVLDFGISKLADAEPTATLTGTGAVLGTPHYMSPEQARGGEVVDARSDQYSLGVVLYQCVTGRRPLQGVPLYSLIQRTVHGDFPPPRQVLPALPSAFEEVILRAMARDPERRFPSTRALGQALLPFVSEGLRAAYAAELGGADISPASAPRKPAVLADALSSTLGESAHARPVTGARPRGSFGWLVGALLLVVGTIAWRFVQSSSTASTAALPSTVPAASTPPEASASATRALRPSLANDVPSGAERAQAPDLTARANHLLAEAELHLAQGQLPLAVDAFRRAYALNLDPEALRRAAEAQARLWRSTPGAAQCREARDLWSAHLAVVRTPAARGAAQAALAELGECAEHAAPGRAASRAAQRAPAATPTSKRPAPRPLLPAAAPASAERTGASPALPLPSEDPVDGLMDIEPAGQPHERP